jgi:pyrophosphatase PpaX
VVVLSDIAGVLFDLDGTLIDTVDLIHRSFDYAVRTVLGRKLSRSELLQNMGRPLAVQMRCFSRSKVNELLEAYNEHNLVQHDKYISAYPGTADTLAWIKSEKKMRMGVVTSKKRDLCLRGLEITGLRNFFEAIVAMEDTSHHKPDPQPVFLALEQLELQPSQSVFIGDSPFDIVAGNRAGVFTGAALWGPFAPALLRAEQPDFELHDIADLRRSLA